MKNKITPKKRGEIQNLIRSIPAEHRKTINILMDHFYKEGVNDAFCLMLQTTDVPLDKVRDYVVVHKDDLDGG